jgi:hypothetical protein
VYRDSLRRTARESHSSRRPKRQCATRRAFMRRPRSRPVFSGWASLTAATSCSPWSRTLSQRRNWHRAVRGSRLRLSTLCFNTDARTTAGEASSACHAEHPSQSLSLAIHVCPTQARECAARLRVRLLESACEVCDDRSQERRAA